MDSDSCTSKTAGRRAKWTKIWALGGGGTYCVQVLLTVMWYVRSFGAFPINSKTDGCRTKWIKIWTSGVLSVEKYF